MVQATLPPALWARASAPDIPDAGHQRPANPPPLGSLLDELTGRDELTRRCRIHEVIRTLGDTPAAVQQQYRDSFVGAGHLGARDWLSLLAEAICDTWAERNTRASARIAASNRAEACTPRTERSDRSTLHHVTPNSRRHDTGPGMKAFEIGKRCVHGQRERALLMLVEQFFTYDTDEGKRDERGAA
jgi:hypothetical protein